MIHSVLIENKGASAPHQHKKLGGIKMITLNDLKEAEKEARKSNAFVYITEINSCDVEINVNSASPKVFRSMNVVVQTLDSNNIRYDHFYRKNKLYNLQILLDELKEIYGE